MLNLGLEGSINYKELMSLKVLKGLGGEKEILKNDVYLTERKVNHRHSCPGSDVPRKQKAAGLEGLANAGRVVIIQRILLAEGDTSHLMLLAPSLHSLTIF